jgi:hypothetical protein
VRRRTSRRGRGRPRRDAAGAGGGGRWRCGSPRAPSCSPSGWITGASDTLLSLIEARRSRVLEAAVVVLIAIEVGTTLYGFINR